MADQVSDASTSVKEENLSGTTAQEAGAGQIDILVRFAQNLASSLITLQPFADQEGGKVATPLLENLKSCEKLLHEAYHIFQGAIEDRISLSYASEWMLDNYYIVQQSFREIKENLPPGFYRELPAVSQGNAANLPRIYIAARKFLSLEHYRLDIPRLASFIEAFQTQSELTMGELWALSSTIRIVMAQALTYAVAHLTGLQDRLEIMHQKQQYLQLEVPENLAHDDIVANCIIGLRTMVTYDWEDFFKATSHVEQTLSLDPARIFSLMETGTRDRYRKAIGDLARGSGKSELEVARLAIELCSAEHAHVSAPNNPPEYALRSRTGPIDGGDDVVTQIDEWDGLTLPRSCHVGYYLVAGGRIKLEQLIGYRSSSLERIRRWILGFPTYVYLGSIFLLSSGLSSILVGYAVDAGGSLIQALILGLLSLLLTSTVAVNLVNWLFTSWLEPRLLPKLDFDEGIPDCCRTLVVIPAILSDSSEVEGLLKQIEMHYLRNPDNNLSFALLTDLSDAPQEHLKGDKEIIDCVGEGIHQLNLRYPRAGNDPFLLLHRGRKWNPQEGTWMGWERKRGKLHELNRLILEGGSSPFKHHVGDLSLLSKIRYVITLDADTILPGQSARRLVAAIAHPLNRAEYELNTGRVRAGYTILQPRIEISPTSANRSFFARVFSGDIGLDLYTLAVSDIYQDLFGAGIYIGKGIYDVENFERSLEGVIPENTLLSHDLFEGIHGRVGLITDVSLVEAYPHNYLLHVNRMHRWIRGDWQLLPWLLRRVPSAPGGNNQFGSRGSNRLTWIDRWKIFDNLRRSMLAPALMLFLMAGWTWLPGSPLIWTTAGIFSLAVPIITGVFRAVLTGMESVNRRYPLSLRTRPIRDELYRWILALIFLPYEAFMATDAIVVTVWRIFITRRNLLQWTTTAKAAALFRLSRDTFTIWNRMAISSLLAVGIGIWLIFLDRAVFLLALPWLTVWLLSPRIAYAISSPTQRDVVPLQEEQNRQLRALARLTWLYFEQFVTPEDHWLPPDHYQESPRGMVAHRTSPTNIGLSLLSTLAAYDFGYTGILELSAQLNAAFENISKLERYRGHLLNWYDTRSLEPLNPRYVSTVDSGNLAGSLITLGQGCLEMGDRPILRQSTCEGFLDTLDMLVELIDQIEQKEAWEAAVPLEKLLSQIRQDLVPLKENVQGWVPYLLKMSAPEKPEISPVEIEISQDILDKQILEFVESAGHLIGAENLSRLRISAGRVRFHLESFRRKNEMLLPWVISFINTPAFFDSDNLDPGILDLWDALKQTLPFNAFLFQVSEISKKAKPLLAQLEESLGCENITGELVNEAQQWCTHLKKQLASAAVASEEAWNVFLDLHAKCEQLVQEMDFGFLFDQDRQIFHIGYNLELGRLDANYYDLLASESRITSLIAIAYGHVPQSHWLHLSRPFTQLVGTRALLSWSATMFEYLMPDMFLRNYEGTLLSESSRAAIDYQIRYGRLKRVPWGISESSYYHFDDNMVYQYRAFGVPGLGFKRGLAEDLVITPYASLLALPGWPGEVAENVQKLHQLGMMGTFGLYEAIDFTDNRIPPGENFQIVRSFMAHHQGMILISLVNYFMRNIMVDRFHSNPHIRSVELLLQEQVPKYTSHEQPHAEDGRALPPEEASLNLSPWIESPEPPQPRVHFLSNGRYQLMITSSGAGFSTWRGIGLTRFQTDPTLNRSGTWIYISEVGETGQREIWSPAMQPCGSSGDNHEVLFFPHQLEFRNQHRDISAVMEITVAPEDDLEIRRVSLTNQSDRPRRISLTSYGEVVLAPMLDDQRHPAFSKLFVESEYVPDQQLLLFHRRARSNEEKPSYLAHTFVLGNGASPEVDHLSFETDRARFIGRGGTDRSPHVLSEARQWLGLSKTTGATLDPIMAIHYELNLQAHETVQAAFITSISDSRQSLINTIHRYREWHLIERAFDQARASAELELRRLGIDTPTLEKYQKLLSVLLYPHVALRTEPSRLAINQAGQPSLWAHGISGDYPILLLKIENQDDSTLVKELLLGHAYWRKRGLLIDLVFLNMQGSNYGQELNSHLRRLISATNGDRWMNRRGGIFLVNLDRLREVDRILLETAARAVLDATKGSLAEQLEKLEHTPNRLPPFAPIREHIEEEITPPLHRPDDLLFDNGFGGFTPDGCEYVIYLEPGQFTPAPWVNIIANPDFGFLVSETGSGYTWAINSGENRLSPWSNDPLSDPPSEAIYFRDEETAEIWTPTPLPAPAPYPYLIRHRAGCSSFEHHSYGLKQSLHLFVAPEDPIKIIQVRLENTTGRVRRITATYYVEWVLGLNRETTQQYILPDYDSGSQALLATNSYHTEFAERVAFLASSHAIHSLTTDRTEFLGRLGSHERPAALGRIGLTGRVEPGRDPCAAIQVHIDLQPGAVEELHFLLGQGNDRAHAQDLIQRFSTQERVTATRKAAIAGWDRWLGTIQVHTPDPAMDLLLNRWLLYQSLACRIWGRSGFYQSSGAYGFRDQLQDILSVIYAAPEEARMHILRAARYQFEAGDVLHWWHPPSGRGVRTRYSDDLLWLPYVTAGYVSTTGDLAILDEKVPYLRGQSLEKEEKERYGHYESTEQAYTLFDHCRRALAKGATTGPHQLPLMGAGDWNDGMNRVGIEGHGESVWLAWFLVSVLEQFADLCERRGDQEQADSYCLLAQKYRSAIEKHAWDGDWYLRAFYDDGTPLGSTQNRECQIDAIAQSWAVLSRAGQVDRATRAMKSVAELLVIPEDRLLLLLKPPFDKTPRDPGYIKGYLPGIRENGGQYTHAALWTIWAYAKLGQGDYAGSLFQMLNPIYHSDTPQKMERYKVEPYAIAADVYSRPPHTGRGGWTWYTGSAGWMYRLGLEGLLGLNKAGDSLFFNPCIPADWKGYSLEYRYSSSLYRIEVENPSGVSQGIKRVTLDERVIENGRIPLVDDGETHRVRIVLGNPAG